MIFSDTRKKRDTLFFYLILLTSLILFLYPTKGSRILKQNSTKQVKAKIVEVDNSEVNQFGIIKTGDQSIIAVISSGAFKGITINTINTLMGKLELDKIFTTGDSVLVTLNLDETEKQIISSSIVDHYRINTELFLFLFFIIILVLYSGWTGVRAISSFIFTGLIIWKILIPGFLAGYNPIVLANLVVAVFTGVIIFVIAGFNRTGITAFISAIFGVILTTILAIVFGGLFKIHGAVKPFTEMLLYAGYPHLDITKIFLSGIFLASSGAVMDIAMDISASMKEVRDKKQDITQIELLKSGLKVGRAVVGTMTTTLLLAYSGGYISLLMIFMAQETPIINILNLNYVSAEILHTLVGSFGLITVAPLTALIGSFIILYDR